MKRRYKISILSLLLGVVMSLGQSCEKWLDITEFNKIPYDEFWQTKEDVDGMVSGAYTRMRQSIQTIFYWGELRGDSFERNPSYNKDNGWVNRVIDVKSLEIKQDNEFAKYADMYAVINRCNQIIEWAPGVLELDETFDETLCKQLVAEMKWLRCLAYFYLVRSFKDVPYVTEPYMDDHRDFAVAKSKGEDIMNYLIAELRDITRPYIPGVDEGGWLVPQQPGVLWQQKGRGCVYAAYALMADIYLWQEDYENALLYCNKIINTELYPLVETFTSYVDGQMLGIKNKEWYNKLFGTGNSTESIFELQWSGDQVNGIFELTVRKKDDSDHARLRIPNSLGNSETGKLFGKDSGLTRPVRAGKDPDNDNKWQNVSVNSDLRLWKYAASSYNGGARGDGNRSMNFIVYRTTEVYLMKAEALIMMEADGEQLTQNYTEAYEIINMIRLRGGFDGPHPAQFTNQQAGLEYLLLEKQREFLGEGKRWYDLVRVAMKKDKSGQNAYKNILIDIMVADIPADVRDVYRSKLEDPNGYFFPIYVDEIENSGGVVVQNPYYRN